MNALFFALVMATQADSTQVGGAMKYPSAQPNAGQIAFIEKRIFKNRKRPRIIVKEHLCSATVVSETHALTTAECLINERLFSYVDVLEKSAKKKLQEHLKREKRDDATDLMDSKDYELIANQLNIARSKVKAIAPRKPYDKATPLFVQNDILKVLIQDPKNKQDVIEKDLVIGKRFFFELNPQKVKVQAGGTWFSVSDAHYSSHFVAKTKGRELKTSPSHNLGILILSNYLDDRSWGQSKMKLPNGQLCSELSKQKNLSSKQIARGLYLERSIPDALEKLKKFRESVLDRSKKLPRRLRAKYQVPRVPKFELKNGRDKYRTLVSTDMERQLRELFDVAEKIKNDLKISKKQGGLNSFNSIARTRMNIDGKMVVITKNKTFSNDQLGPDSPFIKLENLRGAQFRSDRGGALIADSELGAYAVGISSHTEPKAVMAREEQQLDDQMDKFESRLSPLLKEKDRKRRIENMRKSKARRLSLSDTVRTRVTPSLYVNLCSESSQRFLLKHKLISNQQDSEKVKKADKG